MSATDEPTERSAPTGSAVPWYRRLRDSTTGSWLAVLVWVGVPFIAANIASKLLIDDPGLRNLLKTIVLFASYWAYVHWWEHRPVRELSASRAVPEFLAGLLLGALLFCIVVVVLIAAGAYDIETVGTLGQLGTVTAAMLPKIAIGALLEEVLFRLVLLRLLERSLGTIWALVLSSLVFGLAHLGNTGATPAISVMLGVELGLLFGAAYVLTGRLWLCAALHLAWNFVQGAIFSIAVSGQSGDGWLQATLSGPAWLTGGAFGAEGSVVSAAVCLAATAGLLVMAHRRGRLGLRHAPRPG